jgi:UDP-N-acetylmuramate--alanine ligase
MRALPLNIGIVHFIGIGGIGMSGIAEVLHSLGYTVQGSDISESTNIDRLRGMGILVFIGHLAENLADSQVVVVSTAVKDDNPEVIAARQKLIPVVRRAEMLGELMRLKWSVAVGGTHGKTTTTSIVSAMLDTAGLDPTFINGGIINAWGTNARLGKGDWLVAEADESDGTFLKLPAIIAVVTNIDPEHLDHYGTFDNLRGAFDAFVQNIPFYGFAALCIDHAEVQAMIPRVSDRRLITYGLSPQADVRAINLEPDTNGTQFDVVLTDRKSGLERSIRGLRMPMVGSYNVQNALAAVAIAYEMGLEDNIIRQSLSNFEGVKRRFTKTGEVDGITVIDDYGHHPVEISAVLNAARQATHGRVIAVVQPHRYSRLRDLFEGFCTCFNNADIVFVADIYAAGEVPIEGVNQESFVAGLRHHGHRNVELLINFDDLATSINAVAKNGDLVVCLGAGNISHWANLLPKQLAALKSSNEGCAG